MKNMLKSVRRLNGLVGKTTGFSPVYQADESRQHKKDHRLRFTVSPLESGKPNFGSIIFFLFLGNVNVAYRNMYTRTC